MSDTDWLYDQIEDLKAENAALRELLERAKGHLLDAIAAAERKE